MVYASEKKLSLSGTPDEGAVVQPDETVLVDVVTRLDTEAKDALEAAEEAIASIDGVVSENSEFRYQIDQFLRELTLAARSLRAFADYLERNPDALLRGKTRREGQR